MKKIIILLLVVFSQNIFAQNKPKSESVFSDSYLRLYAILPNQFGEHSLAKAHSPRVGVGGSLYLVKYYNFRLGGGLEFVSYSVTDKSKIGEINNSNYSNYFISVAYDYKINKNILLQPIIGYGDVDIKLKTVDKKFTNQNGNEFRIGSIIDYKLNNTFCAFLSLQYIYTSIDINTNSAYKDYFGKAQQFQVSLGFKIY